MIYLRKTTKGQKIKATYFNSNLSQKRTRPPSGVPSFCTEFSKKLQFFIMGNLNSSPLIINNTNQEIVVFQECGCSMQKKQILRPGEAVDIEYDHINGTSQYSIHAMIGDRKKLPTNWTSFGSFQDLSMIALSAIEQNIDTILLQSETPSTTHASAFVSMLNNTLLIQDDDNTTEGSLIDIIKDFGGTEKSAKALYEKYPSHFKIKKSGYFRGERYVAVRGGMSERLELIDIDKERAMDIVKKKLYPILHILGKCVELQPAST